jgi:hypothetical protein
LEKKIDKFLNILVGDGINISELDFMGTINNFTTHNKVYNIKSDNGTLVLYVTLGKSMRDGRPIQEITHSIYNDVSEMFSISTDESEKYVMNWFLNKHNLKDEGEVFNYLIEHLSKHDPLV